MGEAISESGTAIYATREVEAVFATAEAREAAVQQLAIEGVNRAAISVPVAPTAGPSAPTPNKPPGRRGIFVTSGSRVEANAIVVAFPALIGGFGAAWLGAAESGSLVTVSLVAMIGALAGAGLGLLVLRAMTRRHAARMQAPRAQGGLLLWVSTPDAAAESRALKTLQRCGGTSVHAHTAGRRWGVENSPLHGVQPDPFLENDQV